MDQIHSTTIEHKKGQHLTFEERVLIQTQLKDGWKPNRIAAEIGYAPNTIRNEIKRGTVALYTRNVHRYKARALLDGDFTRDQIVCTKTLYNYIDLGSSVSRISICRRSRREPAIRENKCILGRSIEERPAEIQERKEFGHWECDLVIGSKSVERHNGLIRRSIPKGKRIDSFTDDQISQVELWCNSLPRKMLGYRTPDELFEVILRTACLRRH